MRTAALIVAFFVIVVGVVGLIAPDRWMALGHYVVTPPGLYVIAVLRIAFGLVMIRVAGITRVPKVLRVIGVVLIAAGIATPIFGVERTRAVLDWEAAHGTNFLRAIASLLVVIGGLLAFAVVPARRPTSD